MLDKIKESFTKFSDRNAFYFQNKYYTYSDLAQRVSNIRSVLNSTVQPDEKVIGLLIKNNIETYSGILGIQFAGYGYVPINPENPVERNREVINQAEIKTIITGVVDDEIKHICENLDIKIVAVSTLENVPINLELPDVGDDSLAYIFFTSGSTGKPKGVPITRANVKSFFESFQRLGYSIDENDRYLQMFELTFDLSVGCYVIPLSLGCCVYPVPDDGIKFANIYSVLEDHKITFAWFVPSVLAYLRPYFEEMNFPDLKYSLFCGEALYEELTKEWLKCTPNGKVINAYGPTEATIFCMIYNWDEENGYSKSYNGMVCIGKEMDSTKILIVDDNNIPVKPGETGELCLSGSQVTPGYWRNEENNRTAFFKHNLDGKETIFYKTGDLAFLDKEGDCFYIGRKDFQVKIQGFRVELSEIEHHVRTFTNIPNVCVIPYQDKNGSTVLHLFIEGFNGNGSEIIEHLNTKVPFYMIPVGVTSVQAFPLNQNGKVDRKKLLLLLNT
ncbi:MAG TPA: amino acid adenylation domain-containing protein [Ignavibacteriaceae bacterium]|nr:amino acid adenylation domain-containing protein [Ignavibacteriaceae bacterium]